MDYKEIHQECYENLVEDLKREPTWKEVEASFQDRISNIIDCLSD